MRFLVLLLVAAGLVMPVDAAPFKARKAKTEQSTAKKPTTKTKRPARKAVAKTTAKKPAKKQSKARTVEKRPMP